MITKQEEILLKTLNRIEDYFEYTGCLKDKAVVYDILDQCAAALAKAKRVPSGLAECK